MADGNLVKTLRFLIEAEIQFVVVGGVAAVLNGAPVDTLDFDLVYSLEPLNIQRLVAALDRIDAIFRIQPERHLRPDHSHLVKAGHLKLLTRFGPIGLLGSIGHGLGYSRLVPESREMELGGDVRVPVLNLETIIKSKEQIGAEKDRAVLSILRQTLAEQKKSPGSP